MPNWVSLIFFGCFTAANNAADGSRSTTTEQGCAAYLPCLAADMQQSIFTSVHWSLAIQPLVFFGSLCLMPTMRGRGGQCGWTLRTILASVSLLSGMALLVRPLGKALTGIAVMYDRQDNSNAAASSTFSEELSMEALLLLAVAFTAVHGVCIICLASVVNVRYRGGVLMNAVLPLLRAQTETGTRGMTEDELAEAVIGTGGKDGGEGEALQCLCDLEWLGAAVRDDASGGGTSKTRWFSTPGGGDASVQSGISLQSRFRARGGASSFFLPLFSEQVHPGVRKAQISFWRQHFSGPEWKGKRIRVASAMAACGCVLAETVARDVFDDEVGGASGALEGWWEGPTGETKEKLKKKNKNKTRKNKKTTFQLFTRPIAAWGEILRQEHENVINPGHSDNVCTVGELEETLVEFKALPRPAKWKILHGLVAQGVAKLDVIGDVSDTGIIWKKH